MKKTEPYKSWNAEGTKPFYRRVFFPLLSVFLLMLVQSCEKPGVSGNAAADSSAVPAGVISPVVDGSAREMVLIRGNYRVSGIPGFGVNGFSALAGEYRFMTPENGGDSLEGGEKGDFSVHLTTEALYFSGEWQPRPGMGDIPVLQRSGEEGFLAATVLDDSRGAWTAVFRFPGGLEGAGISGEFFNRVLRIWTSRFSYFLSLSRASSDASLPAVLEF